MLAFGKMMEARAQMEYRKPRETIFLDIKLGTQREEMSSLSAPRERRYEKELHVIMVSRIHVITVSRISMHCIELELSGAFMEFGLPRRVPSRDIKRIVFFIHCLYFECLCYKSLRLLLLISLANMLVILHIL